MSDTYYHVHTRSGQKIDLNNVLPEQIVLKDIAWGLAGLNRWTAQGAHDFYVTDHAALVYDLVKADPTAQSIDLVGALIHDAPEYITTDISAPIKKFLSQFTDALERLEQHIESAIRKRFDIGEWNRELIHKYDLQAREIEREFQFGNKQKLDRYYPYDRSTRLTRAAHYIELVSEAMDEVRGASHFIDIFQETLKAAESVNSKPTDGQPPRGPSPLMAAKQIAEEMKQVRDLLKSKGLRIHAGKSGVAFCVIDFTAEDAGDRRGGMSPE